MKHFKILGVGLLFCVGVAAVAAGVVFGIQALHDNWQTAKWYVIIVGGLLIGYAVGDGLMNDYKKYHNKKNEAIDDEEYLEDDIQCHCTEEEKHGETSIMCCNQCGLPTEEFWTRKISNNE